MTGSWQAILRWLAGDPVANHVPSHVSSRRGVILVMVLWTVVVLSVLAATLAFDVQINSRLARLQREQFLAYNLARSAVAVGMTDLLNDAVVDFVEDAEQPNDGFGDVWAQPGVREEARRVRLGEDGPERRRGGRDIKFTEPTFEYQIRDEEAKLPLNSATPQLLQSMFEVYGLDQEDAQLVAAAISDYRDADDVASARDAAGVKENEYWSSAIGQDTRSITFTGEFAVRMPNEPFHSLDQLMDVPGVPAHIFYGFDPRDEDTAAVYQNRAGNLDEKGMRKPRSSAQSGNRVGQNGDLTPLREILTVRTYGTAATNRVNLNTASVEVLTILLHAANNGGSVEQARSTAEAFVRSRGDDRGARSMDREDALKGPDDLGKAGGGGMEKLRVLISNPAATGLQIAFRSENFEITGIGRIGNTEKVVTCWVQRNVDVFNPDDPRLLPVKEERRSIFRAAGFGAARRLGERKQMRAVENQAGDNFIRIPAVRVTGWAE
jgi:type II secretory pathway component PulK